MVSNIKFVKFSDLQTTNLQRVQFYLPDWKLWNLKVPFPYPPLTQPVFINHTWESCSSIFSFNNSPYLEGWWTKNASPKQAENVSTLHREENFFVWCLTSKQVSEKIQIKKKVKKKRFVTGSLTPISVPATLAVYPVTKWYIAWSLVSLDTGGRTPKASQAKKTIFLGWVPTPWKR